MNFSEAFVVELFVLLVFDLTLFWRLVCLFDIPRRVFACVCVYLRVFATYMLVGWSGLPV